MAGKVHVEIFKTVNGQFSFRVKRGGNIILGPEEAYKLRGGVRRAVRSLATVATDESLGSYVSPLQAACWAELDREQAAWNSRKQGVAS